MSPSFGGVGEVWGRGSQNLFSTNNFIPSATILRCNSLGIITGSPSMCIGPSFSRISVTSLVRIVLTYRSSSIFFVNRLSANPGAAYIGNLLTMAISISPS